jgi:nucleotidyltransferase AbiEii toxin of type IV toxin-antitoxin system
VAALEVAVVLDALGVPYYLGGSLASSFHGIPRTSEDADLVADLLPRHVRPFVDALSGRFYVDAERVAGAVRRRASFNVVHLRLAVKVDVFVARDTPLARRALSRRQLLPVADRETPVASAEDIVLEKLRWYEMGGRASERQWLDVLGVLKVQRGHLDLEYLRQGAAELGVEALLVRVLAEAG